MKKLLIAVLEDHHITELILKELSSKGFNGTVIPSTSLKHTLENGGEIPMFINLSVFDSDHLENNTTLELILEEEHVLQAMEIIRKVTHSFTKCHGAMYTLDIKNFEGSF